MREFPIKRFWYGKGAAYKSIEELIDKNPKWFIWAVETFQDVTAEQAEHFKKTYGMELPPEVIAKGDIIKDINGGVPYEYHKGDTEETYKNLCRQYANALGLKWNAWLEAGYDVGEWKVKVEED